MVNLGKTELLQIVDSVARDKNLSREFILIAIEKAIEAVGKKKYGQEYDIKTEINRKNGDAKLYHILHVAEKVTNVATEISLNEAKRINIDAKIGDEIHNILPNIDLSRISAKIARDVIISCIKDAEKDKEFNEFNNRVGEIINGIVTRVEVGNVIVSLANRSEALLKKDQLLFNDTFKINDRVKAYIQQVIRNNNSHQILLSRTDNNMMAKLFALEVPEIYEGSIQIRAIARDPGLRSKVAVFAKDLNVDPISCCIGPRGSRVRAVTNELNGEKIDIILWNPDIAQFIINILDPIVIEKVLIYQEKNKIEIIVKKEHLSLIIGKKGQNIKLISKLSGWRVDVMSDEEEAKKRGEEFNSSTKVLIDALDIDEVLAQLLVVEGLSLEHLASTTIENLLLINGIDNDIAQELKTRAIEYLENQNEKILIQLEDLGADQDLLDYVDLPLKCILNLAQNKILSINDFIKLTPHKLGELLTNIDLNPQELDDLLHRVSMQINEKKS